MRSFILVIAFIVFFFTSSHAQLKLGLQAGVDLSRTLLSAGAYKSKNEFKPFFTAGVNGDIPIASHLSAQFVLRYTMVTIFPLGSHYISYNRAYCHALQLPASIVYKLGRRGGNQLGIAAGAYGAWHVSGRKYVFSTSDHVPLDIGYEVRYFSADDITTFDFGLTGALSYELKNGLFFTARYQRGLANVCPAKSQTSQKIESINVNVGYYLFRIQSKKHAHTASAPNAK